MILLRKDDVLDSIECDKSTIHQRLVSEISGVEPVYAELVKYAFWKFRGDRAIVDGKDWECSNCRKAQRCKENYCPNCGARMVEEAQ